MVAVNFVHFLAMFILASITIRFMQILGRNTWLAPALGAIHS